MLVTFMLTGILGLILLMVVGGEMGKRVQPQGETEQAETIGAGQQIKAHCGRQGQPECMSEPKL